MSTRTKLTLLSVVLLIVLVAGYTGTPSAAESSGDIADPHIGQLISKVDTAILTGYVADLSGDRPVLIGGQPYTFETRYSRSEGIKKATQYLYEHYETLGLQTSYHEYAYDDNIWRNVQAELPGVREPDRIYIVCAHADSSSGNPMTDSPGADDNGSGTAAVMIAADILSRYDFEYTIRFVNFSGEEQGLLGSAAYAAQARRNGENIAGVINLDMLGWDGKDGPDMDLHAGTDGDSLAIAQTFSETISLYDLDLLPQIIGTGAARASDHSSFWDKGYAAVLAIEDYIPNRNDFNPYYHTGNDLLANMDHSYFTTITKAMVGTLATLAEPVTYIKPTATPTAEPLFSIFLPRLSTAGQ